MDQPRTFGPAGFYAGVGGAVSMLEGLLEPQHLPRSPLAPPAPVIGAVWSILFALFGAARGRLHQPRARRELDLLWLLCVTYPLYTRGQRSRPAELIGNAVIGAQSARVIGRAARTDLPAALLVAPVIPWVLYATAIVLTDRKRPR